MPLSDLDPAATQRAAILHQLGLMDDERDEDFEELLKLATTICGKRFGAVTLLDETTQLMKARVGFLGSRSMPLRDSICQYTVRGTELMMVEDVGLDPRFAGNRALEEDTDIRFYAGMPLISESGCALGALCVMDTAPSTLSLEQQGALRILARQMSHRIQMRQRTAAVTRMMEERDRDREMFNTILNNVPVEIYLKDAAGKIRFYNRKVAVRFGIDQETWLGKTSFDLWDQATAIGIHREEEYVVGSGRSHTSFLELPETDGRISFWSSTKIPIRSASGEQVLACCSIDITEQMERERQMQTIQDELEEANRKLNSLALTDALTGLWNRRAFDARLETGIIGAQRSRSPLSLLLLDADDFKSINDRFGHPYGDEVLKNIAAILNRAKRAEDVACRYGGEEFAVLLPGSDVVGSTALANRVLQAMQQFVWQNGGVTMSIGMAVCSDTCSADELIDRADTALYQAKLQGKNRAILYSPQA